VPLLLLEQPKGNDDPGRFLLALSPITGKQLHYERLTGIDREAGSEPAASVILGEGLPVEVAEQMERFNTNVGCLSAEPPVDARMLCGHQIQTPVQTVGEFVETASGKQGF
jgi:hypothetical protein